LNFENSKSYTVFVASPSDLGDERKKAFEVANEVNKLFNENGLSIDLLGWEDRFLALGDRKHR